MLHILYVAKTVKTSSVCSFWLRAKSQLCLKINDPGNFWLCNGYNVTSDFVWTIGDKRQLSSIDIDGHKVTVLVVPKFSSTSEFSIITFDPEQNDILCEDGSIDFEL